MSAADLRAVATHSSAIHRGFADATAEHERRGGDTHRVVVVGIVETAVDASDDAVRCAGTGAIWKGLGRDERDLTFVFKHDEWQVEFVRQTDRTKGAD